MEVICIKLFIFFDEMKVYLGYGFIMMIGKECIINFFVVDSKYG